LLNVPSGPFIIRTMVKIEITKHELVPKHSKLSEKECKELFEKYGIDVQNLPRIFRADPAIQHLDIKEDDVIKINRTSPTAGTTVFFRRVAL